MLSPSEKGNDKTMERRVILQGALALPALAAVGYVATAPAAPVVSAVSAAPAAPAPRQGRHRSWLVDDLAPKRKAGRS